MSYYIISYHIMFYPRARGYVIRAKIHDPIHTAKDSCSTPGFVPLISYSQLYTIWFHNYGVAPGFMPRVLKRRFCTPDFILNTVSISVQELLLIHEFSTELKELSSG
jgi:hypothetical protein